jgi:hypothetical protein
MTSKILTITLALCLAPSITAQTSTTTTRPAGENASISDDNFAVVAQDIRELKRPEVRALLRARLLDLTRTSDSTERRQASLSVATEALSDLCANQDGILQPQASWLYRQVTAAVKNFDPDGAESLAGKFSLKKDDSGSDASRDLSAAIGMMNDPSRASSAKERAVAAILTGEVPATSLMAHLRMLQNTNSSGLAPLLSATLTVEDQKPGFVPLMLVPFFAGGVFLANSTPADIQARFVSMVVRRTRLSPEELTNSIVRSQVVTALQTISEPTKSLVPALYPELAARLNSLAPAAAALRAERQAAEDRIKTSSDQLEQLLSEAQRTSDPNYRSGFLARAAGLALTQGKLREAVDLAASAYGDSSSNSFYLDRFLASVNSAAVKKEDPDVIVYAVSKMGKPLNKANGLIVLCKYYAGAKETQKTAAALHDAAKALKDAPNNNEKLSAAISLAKGFVEYDRAAAFDAFRQIVNIINNLPAPEKQKEKTYYVSLMPMADELIKSFRLFSAQDESGAFAIAQDIKVAELRVSALSGVYSHSRVVTR